MRLRLVAVSLALHACFTVTVPASLVLLAREFGLPFFSHAAVQVVGALLILGGALVYVRAVYELAIASRTSAVPFGVPERLRTEGLFARMRNPTLLGVVGILFGEALFFGQPLLLGYALAYWAALHVFVTCREEPELARRFGSEYRGYQSRVPRWLPRLRSRSVAA